jgi:hypothetical protein
MLAFAQFMALQVRDVDSTHRRQVGPPEFTRASSRRIR